MKNRKFLWGNTNNIFIGNYGTSNISTSDFEPEVMLQVTLVLVTLTPEILVPFILKYK